MLNHIRENIDTAQELAKQELSLMLKEKGYVLIVDKHHTEGIEVRLFKWRNQETKDLVQLIWDGRESWFDLSVSFAGNRLEQVIYKPYRSIKRFNRDKYTKRTIEALVRALKERLN